MQNFSLLYLGSEWLHLLRCLRGASLGTTQCCQHLLLLRLSSL